MIWQLAHDRHIKIDRILVMGVLNVTPDSFSDGGNYFTPEEALNHAREMVEQGADIIDIGGQSTRPGYTRVTPQGEWSRLKPIISTLCSELKVPVSIDTFYPEVAARAIMAGACIINDVNGFDELLMRQTAALSKAGCIITHHTEPLGGISTPLQIKNFFIKRMAELKTEGVEVSKMCFDPGIGFGKSNEQNLAAIANFDQLCIADSPMLIAASRKRVLGTATGVTSPEERDPATVAAHTAACMKGANIVRAHNIPAAVQAARIADALLNNKGR